VDPQTTRLHKPHNRLDSACGADHRIHKPAATIFFGKVNIKNRASAGVHFSALNALKTVHFSVLNDNARFL
jgi:hypothetical protein